MSKPTALELSQAEFESLHADLERTRQTSTTVKVSREALRKLLSDHSKLHAQDAAFRRPWAGVANVQA